VGAFFIQLSGVNRPGTARAHATALLAIKARQSSECSASLNLFGAITGNYIDPNSVLHAICVASTEILWRSILPVQCTPGSSGTNDPGAVTGYTLTQRMSIKALRQFHASGGGHTIVGMEPMLSKPIVSSLRPCVPIADTKTKTYASEIGSGCARSAKLSTAGTTTRLRISRAEGIRQLVAKGILETETACLWTAYKTRDREPCRLKQESTAFRRGGGAIASEGV
jgi:hypothetical protein